MFKYNIMLTGILCTFLSAGLVNCRAEGVGTAVPDIPQVVPEQAWLHDPFTPSTLMYERARMQGGKCAVLMALYPLRRIQVFRA